MTTTLNAPTNGGARRSLNDTIGRLDEMIDGLSTAIPETIRDTLQETVSAAVGEGVRAALVEVLSNPEFLAVLRSNLTPEPPVDIPVPLPPVSPGLLAKLTVAGATAGRWCWSKLRGAGQATANCARQGVSKLVALRLRLESLRQARKPLLLAFAVGGLAAVIALVAPNWVAAALSGLGGACMTMSVQVGLWLRQRFGSLVGAFA
jgi:predicted permease